MPDAELRGKSASMSIEEGDPMNERPTDAKVPEVTGQLMAVGALLILSGVYVVFFAAGIPSMGGQCVRCRIYSRIRRFDNIGNGR